MDYPGDLHRLFAHLAAAIHPSVTVKKVRKWEVEPLPPLPDDPDSYYSRLTKRAQQQRSDGLIVLPPAKYQGKRLREINLEMVKDTCFFGCKVGNLVFYPVSQGKYAAVRGDDLFPSFFRMWFAFKSQNSHPDCASVYYPADDGWQVYAPGNKQILEAIIALVMHAIAPSNPMPSLGECIEADDGSLSLCDAMLSAYQEKSAARDFFSLAIRAPPQIDGTRAFAHGIEWQLERLLQLKLPQSKKLQVLERFLSGGLYPAPWEKLEELLSSPVLGRHGREWGIRAKKETYLAALRFGDEQYAGQLLKDPLIKAIEQSPEAEEARGLGRLFSLGRDVQPSVPDQAGASSE
jgi:hypothetical protein